MLHVVVIGGGAAGFFAAIHAASHSYVTIFEKTNQVLTKVRLSGGGRCNVTHACFEPSQLVQYYPRGHRELLGPFTRFQPKNTMEWFESRGVPLKIESDGRVFPLSNSSETIIQSLLKEAKTLGVSIRLQSRIEKITKGECFEILFATGERVFCDRIILATGGSSQGHALAASFGHPIVPPVPSLFTLNTPSSPLLDLSGVSTEASLKLGHLQEVEPLLLTHFGFSGPPVLRLSAWGARLLHETRYHAPFSINWAPKFEIEKRLFECKREKPSHHIEQENPFQLPKSLWRRLIELTLGRSKRFSDISRSDLLRLSQKLRQDFYTIEGKTTHKEEFVTCGGVSLKELNFKTLESRICPGLFFAGEVLDIDGLTGGFNFQNAWTTGWIAGLSSCL